MVLSEFVCNNSLIVERIFVHLDLTDLYNCVSVCTLWKNIAKKVIGRRDRIFWTLKVDELEAIGDLHYCPEISDKPVRPTVDVSAHLRQILPDAPSEPKLVLMLICNTIKRKFKDSFHCGFEINWNEDFFEDIYYRSSEEDEELEDSDSLEDSQNSEDNQNFVDCNNVGDSEIMEGSKDLVKCEPISNENQSTIITDDLTKWIEDDTKPGALQAMNKPFMDILTRDLPQDCKIVSAFVDGFSGTSEDLGLPRELLRCAGFTAVFFPMILGVEMFDFTCAETHADWKSRRPNYDIRKPYISGLPKDKNIKCILLFVSFEMFTKSILRTIQEDYLKNQNCGIALAGTTDFSEVMSSPYYYSKEVVQNSGPEIATGVAFAGENFHVASVFVKRDYLHSDNILQKLHELKACDFPEENCVAFMVTNVSHHTTYNGYAQRTPEIEAFHEIFPKVPLFAAFGEWVFWTEHLPKAQNGSEPSSTVILHDYDDRFSGHDSVFVLLCFGKA